MERSPRHRSGWGKGGRASRRKVAAPQKWEQRSTKVEREKERQCRKKKRKKSGASFDGGGALHVDVEQRLAAGRHHGLHGGAGGAVDVAVHVVGLAGFLQQQQHTAF